MIRNAINAAWGQVIAAVCMFAVIRLSTEYMTTDDFGTAMLLVGILAFLDGLIGMAFNQTLFSRCGHREGIERHTLAMGLAVTFVGILWLAATAGLTITSILDLFLSINPLIYIIILFLSVYYSADIIKYRFLSIFILEKNYTNYSRYLALEALVNAAVVIITVVFIRPDGLGYAAGVVAARFISVVILWAASLRTQPLRLPDMTLARQELRAAVGYGVPVAMMAPLGWIATYLDRFILASMLGTSTVGSYVAATSIVSRPYALTTSVLTNLFRPKYHDRAGTNAKSHYRHVLRQWLATALVVGGLGAISFYILGPWISFLLLADHFRQDATVIMAAFAAAQTLAIMNHSADNAMLAMGRSKQLLMLQAILSAATLALIPLGIWVWGIFGALAARIVAEAIKLGITAGATLRTIDRHQADRGLNPSQGQGQV